MTHRRLLDELGPGELAYWRATFDLEHDQFERARKEAERKAKPEVTDEYLALNGPRGWRVGANSPALGGS